MNVLILIALLLLAALVGFCLHRLLRIERQLAKGQDLSALTNRLEEALTKLQTLSEMERQLVFLYGSVKTLPGALKAVTDKIDRMFQEFEEKTLPEDSKGVGAQALSRIARARAEMEKQELLSFQAFNDATEKTGGKGARTTPIVARNL